MGSAVGRRGMHGEIKMEQQTHLVRSARQHVGGALRCIARGLSLEHPEWVSHALSRALSAVLRTDVPRGWLPTQTPAPRGHRQSSCKILKSLPALALLQAQLRVGQLGAGGDGIPRRLAASGAGAWAAGRHGAAAAGGEVSSVWWASAQAAHTKYCYGSPLSEPAC